MNKFILVELECAPKYMMLLHTSKIKIIITKVGDSEDEVYSVCLPNPNSINEDIEICITKDFYNRMYAILCDDLQCTPHYPLYISGHRV